MFRTRISIRPETICWVTCLCVLGINFAFPLTPDEAYYWVWSKHLSLSYFDGPPMVSYLIYLVTHFLGNSAFVVRLPSVCCFALTAYCIYRFGLKLFGQKIAEKALIIFIFLPFVQVLSHASTPDSPLMLFWALSLYCFYLALQQGKNTYLYFAGIYAGLVLLSKYMGVLLLPLLFLYLVFSKENRKQLLNPHLYLAALLALLIFSPVVWWNYTHEWAGFLFQWHHGVAEQKIFSGMFLALFIGGQLVIFSPIFFSALVYLLTRKSREILANPALNYLWWPTVIPLLFFMYNGLFTKSQANWTIVSYVSGTLLLAYWIESGRHNKIYTYGNACNIFAALVMSVLVFIPHSPLNKKIRVFPAMVKQASLFIKPGDWVFANKQTLAAQIMFQSAEFPPVYIFDNKRDVFWTAPIKPDHIKHMWLITYENSAGRMSFSNSVSTYRCEKKTDLIDEHAITASKLSLYECFRSLG